MMDLQVTLPEDDGGEPRGVLNSPRHVGSAGKYRYLSPDQLNQTAEPYEYAVICYRRLPRGRNCCRNGANRTNVGDSDDSSADGTAAQPHSPIFLEKGSSEVHRNIIDALCEQGLEVDVIDGGHSGGDMTSDFVILLLRASEVVVRAYGTKLKDELWFRHGNIRDLKLNEHEDNEAFTAAERIEIMDIIVRQGAKLSTRNPWIRAMFPVHDAEVTDGLIRKWISWESFGRMERQREEFIEAVRHQFGEKVAYYFAFVDFYNRSLLPVAVLGVVVWLVKLTWGTEDYMRLLPFWGILVCGVWSFTFQTQWDRKNAELQFQWSDKVSSKQIEHPKEGFYGTKKVDSVTGQQEIVYSPWKRYPKYFCVLLFMLVQISIMLVCVAIWVSIYESIKVHVPGGGLFSLQWWLILLEGIVFGLFVDVFQWSYVVVNVARAFTEWENYPTEESFEKALIRKLFVMDFLNYYTWFFLLAFVYVIPGLGDQLTNQLNHFVFKDPLNCCFGPYVDDDGSSCKACPSHPDLGSSCSPCKGSFTFDREHVDLSAMFVTPIVVTQSLNMLVATLMPLYVKKKQSEARMRADKKAAKKVKEAGGLQIIASLDYTEEGSKIGNKTQQRYLQYNAVELEVLDAKARDILFESEQPCYDPYDDFHTITVQFGFTVMFSIIWPLMPLACMAINAVKIRADGFRLCRTLQRPLPRRSSGIGDWRNNIKILAFIAILVNIALVFISTGCLEFFIVDCVEAIKKDFEKKDKTMSQFIMGPNTTCVSFTTRLALMMSSEHVIVAAVVLALGRASRVPDWVRKAVEQKERKFKKIVKANVGKLSMLASTPPRKETGERGGQNGGQQKSTSGAMGAPSSSVSGKTYRRHSARYPTDERQRSPEPLLRPPQLPPLSTRATGQPPAPKAASATSTRSRIRGMTDAFSPFQQEEKAADLSASTKTQLASAWKDQEEAE